MSERDLNFVSYLFEMTRELGKPFLLGRDETITYRELYREVCSVAHQLSGLTGGKRQYILLCADNGLFFIKVYLATILSGNICVPVDTSITPEACKAIISFLEVKIVCTPQKYALKIPVSNDLKVFDEDRMPSSHVDSEERFCCGKTAEDDIAVVIFTSGTTGKPKGIDLSHLNLYHNTCSINSYLPITTDTIHEVVLPFFYCYGASILHTHLRCGASLVLNNLFMFPETVVEDISHYGCTAFSGVPSTYQVLMRRSNFLKNDLPTLRFMCQAGGNLAKNYIQQIVNCHGNKDFYVMYGQTEATSRLSYLPPRLLCAKLGSIGRGMPGTELKVMDNNFNGIRPGEVGEIYAKGNNVMMGYCMDASLTAEKKVNGWLRTGDLATVDEEGFIYIVGREGDFVKSGGFRISTLEIEEYLKGKDFILDASVLGIPDRILGEAFKAYVVIDKERGIVTVADIMNLCRKELPTHKIPKEIEFVEALPKNSYGKVLKMNLEKIYGQS